MQRRWIVGIALAVVVAGAALFVITRGDDAKGEAPADPGVARNAPNAPRRAAPARDVPAPKAVEPAMPGKSDPTPGIKKWKEPGLPGTFREIVAPDDSENVEEKLIYKKRRLRFRLTDAAASCYDGPDSKAYVALSYRIVIKNGELWVENVRVLEDHLGDHALKECIVGAVTQLRTTAPELPDMTEDQETTIGLHDLYVRNRSAD